MSTNPLIGRVLTKVEIAGDKEAIRFTLADGEVIARCDADCCSHTWVESIEKTAMLPAMVLSVEPVGLPEWENDTDPQIREEWNSDGELERYYGCKITTDRGVLIIDYRNASNGYYGGSLAWPDDSFYGGVYGQQTAGEGGDWTEVV